MITADLCFGFLGGLLTGLLIFVVTFLWIYTRKRQ